MHRMDSAGGVINDEADAAVGAGVVDIPFGAVGVGIVAGVGEEEDGGVVVAAVGFAVHGPELVAGGVDGASDGEGYGCGGVGRGGDGEVGRGGREWVLGIRMDVSALFFQFGNEEDRHWRKLFLCYSRLWMWAANYSLLVDSRRWPGRRVGR